MLAGGRSSRMGRDKAALRWGDVSLLEHMQALLAGTGAEPVWTGGGPNGDVLDLVAGAGPVSSLCGLAERVSAEVAVPQCWLIVPVDMPLLSSAMLQRLIDAGGQAAHFQHQPLPLRLDFDDRTHTACAAMGARLTAGESVAIRALLDSLETISLPATADEVGRLVGANTAAEFAALKTRTREFPSEE